MAAHCKYTTRHPPLSRVFGKDFHQARHHRPEASLAANRAPGAARQASPGAIIAAKRHPGHFAAPGE